MSAGARKFRCDDAAGFALEVTQSSDGDFHLRILPQLEDFLLEYDEEELNSFMGCASATVRIRPPMSGGGSHEALWHALAQVFHPHLAKGRIVPR